jgi:hypothetical protein
MQRKAIIFALLFIFAAQLYLVAQSAGQSHYTAAQANQTLSNATAYVSIINESGYLVFYPNLAQAYSYLNESRQALNSSPSNSIVYADLALASAKSSYQKIGTYRGISLLGTMVFTIIVGLILYRFMKPVGKKR